jgi:outer membrane protein
MKKFAYLLGCIAFNLVLADSHGLLAILNSARENDPGYKSQQYRIKAEQLSSEIKMRSLYPTIQLSASGDIHNKIALGELKASVPLLNYSRMTDQKTGLIAKQSSQLSELELEQDYRISVTSAYFDLLSKNALLNSQKSELTRVQMNYDKTLSMQKSDLASEVDTLSAKSNLDFTNIKVLEAQTNLRHARSNLKKMVNQPIDQLKSLDLDKVASLTVPSSEDILAMALTNNLSFLLIQKSLDKAYSELEKANSKYYPDISLKVGSRHNLQNEFFDLSNKTKTATLSASLNLYNGGRDQLNVKANALKTFAAEDALSDFTYDLEVNSIKAVADFKNTQLKRQAAALSERSAMQKLNAMYEKRQAGQASELELYSAITQATTAKNSHINASHNVIIKYLEVAKLAGNMDDDIIKEIDQILGEEISFDSSAHPSTASDHAAKLLSPKLAE